MAHLNLQNTIMKVGILGLGTVGGGVVNVLQKNSESIERRTGVKIEVVLAGVRDVKQKRICDTSTIKLTIDPFEVVNHPDVDVVLELIGGIGLTKELVETAINNGKHVITANKALIANHGNELIKLANKKQVRLLFEASVAGGIPIIKSLEQGLSANNIESLAGIINGTANFILTDMKEKGRDFDDVLKEAQELGYAEEDPTFDIEGIDAAHKLSILAAIAFGTELQFDKVSTKGISDITTEDIIHASELGYTIKHLGIAKRSGDGIELRVHPTLVPNKQLIAQVDGVMNAVMVKSDALGTSLYYGAGAGDEATASAVIADLNDIINNQTSNHILGWKSQQKLPVIKSDDIHSEFFLRLLVSDIKGVLAKVTGIFNDHNVSIDALIQKQADENNNAHIAITTDKVSTKTVMSIKKSIEASDFNQAEVQIIHIELLD
jgi:homoserine dehydrogenase